MGSSFIKIVILIFFFIETSVFANLNQLDLKQEMSELQSCITEINAKKEKYLKIFSPSVFYFDRKYNHQIQQINFLKKFSSELLVKINETQDKSKYLYLVGNTRKSCHAITESFLSHVKTIQYLVIVFGLTLIVMILRMFLKGLIKNATVSSPQNSTEVLSEVSSKASDNEPSDQFPSDKQRM